MPGWTSGRTVVGARVVSGAETKAFDRGGPVWLPRSNAADDRLGGFVLFVFVLFVSLLLFHFKKTKSNSKRNEAKTETKMKRSENDQMNNEKI